MLQQDALKNKNTHASGRARRRARRSLTPHPGSQFKLAANLPYNVATPILSNLLTGRPAAGLADGDDSEGAGRPHRCPARHEGLLAP